jgi:two-component system response regulator YesN
LGGGFVLKLLIVEDERLEREGLVNFLDWTSYDIQIAGTACDGIEGVELAERIRPDIIITDIKMPGITGIEMSKKIKEFLPRVKIIVLTGYDDFKFAREAICFRASDYILKPVEESEMIASIKKVVNECRREQELLLQETIMKVTIDESYINAKTKFFMDLIEGNYENEGLLENLNRFDINLRSDTSLAITVIKIQDKGRKNVKGLSSSLKTINCHMEDCFQSNENNLALSVLFSFINEYNGELIVGMSIMEKDTELIRKFYKDIMNTSIEKYGLKLLIGMGSVVNKPSDIKISYQGGKEAIEFAEFWDVKDLVAYEEIQALRGDSYEKLGEFIATGNSLSKNLIIEMSSSEKETVFVLLEEMFEYIKLYRNLDKEYIGRYLYNIINEASLFIYNVNGRTETFMEDYCDSSRQFMNLKTFKSMEHYMYNFFEKVINFLNEKRHNKDVNVVKKVMKLVEEKYMKEISLKTIASEVYLSPNYLGNLFKKAVGKSFNEYICEYRMEKAKELLRQGNKKVSAVAQEVGVFNTSYFCILFKNAYGIAPGEFQDMILRGHRLTRN